MKPRWIAVDWGTTHLRAWAMGEAGVLASAASDDGMGRLSRAEFEPALIRLIEGWIGPGVVPVIACGMVGAQQGWQEAPYRTVPCPPLHPGALVSVPTKESRITMAIVPGLKQIDPADVMRGEETQIAGALALTTGFDGCFCLPGTHSKWSRVRSGAVTGFQTSLTGELFALLSRSSVLRHSIASDGWNEDAFVEGLDEGLSRPESIAAALFRIRAAGLIAGLEAEAARARLSGLLIGIELAGARPYWHGARVTLVGSPTLSNLYARALARQDIATTVLNAEECTLAGLALAAGPLSKGAE